jgi:hypothetical protein
MIIVRDSASRSRKSEGEKAIVTQKKLHDALKSLFELLEKYAPVWYEKQHHDQAEAALKLPLARKRMFKIEKV